MEIKTGAVYFSAKFTDSPQIFKNDPIGEVVINEVQVIAIDGEGLAYLDSHGNTVGTTDAIFKTLHFPTELEAVENLIENQRVEIDRIMEDLNVESCRLAMAEIEARRIDDEL